MSRSNITVVVGAKTYVFKPIVSANPTIAPYIDNAPGAAVLFNRLGMELRPAAVNNDGTRVVHRLNFPIAEIVGAQNSQGYVASPKSAGENKLVVNVSLSNRSDLASTTAFVDLVQAYVATAAFRDSLLSQLIPQ